MKLRAALVAGAISLALIGGAGTTAVAASGVQPVRPDRPRPSMASRPARTQTRPNPNKPTPQAKNPVPLPRPPGCTKTGTCANGN